MDKLEKYREAVQEILTEHGSHKTYFPEIEKQIIFDIVRDHYQILNIGWRNSKRTFGCSIHIDIKDGKVWIQENLTEINLADELIKKGVAKEDIVLGFLSPSMRKHSEFAAA